MRALTFIFALCVMALPVHSQNAQSPHEGLCAELSTTPGNVSVRWWGKAGRTYFVQTSATLLPDSWSYLPEVRGGIDAVEGMGMPAPSDKLFVRLVYTDHPYTGNAADADSDGDGVSNAEEVSLGVRTDPFNIDTDRDGMTDKDELDGGSDPKGFNTAIQFAAPEQTAFSPNIELQSQDKYVTNTWRKYPTGGGNEWKESSLWWETTPAGVQDGWYHPNTYGPEWEDQLTALAYPNPQSTNLSAWNRATYFPGYSISAFGAHGDYSSGSTTSFSVEARHKLVTWRTATPPPWKLVAHALRFTLTAPSRTSGASVYSDLDMAFLRMEKNVMTTSEQTELKPAVVDSKRTTETLSLLDFSVAAHPKSLDDFSTLSLNNIPEPRPWLMLPTGVPRQLFVSFGGPASEHVFEITGAGFNPAVQPPATYSTVTLTGGQKGLATMRIGLSPNGSLASAQMFPQPVLNLAVYDRKECHVRIQPIGYQNVPGGSTEQVKYLPSQGAIQSFIDQVFLEQANIKMNITVLPPVGAAWDQGLGPLFLPTPGSPLPNMWHNNDKVLQLLHAFGSGHEDWSTNEDAAILAAAPPSTDPNTITIYWVRADAMITLSWPDEVAETNRLASSTLKRSSCLGLAHMFVQRAGGRVAWVLDRQTSVQWSALHTLAHELGHMLGLFHVFETQSVSVQFQNGENELRLMSDRAGPKKSSGPINLVFGEWTKIRESPILFTPP